MAQQFKSQVKSVVRRLKLNWHCHQGSLTEATCSVSATASGIRWGDAFECGSRTLWKSTSEGLSDSRSTQRKSDLPDVRVDTLNAHRDYVTSWSATQKKKVLKRKLEKRDDDFRKLLSSESCIRSAMETSAKCCQTACSNTEETNGGDGASSIRIVSDKSHCEVRDWLMTRPLIENSGRSGVAANIKVMHGSKYL